MANLAAETKDMGFQLEQVQDFTPTPMTVATVCYYAGIHPYTLEKVYTARTKDEKLEQHRFFFWYKSENIPWIRKVLKNKPELLKKLLERKTKAPKSEGKPGKLIPKSNSKRRSS
jgi:radical SAM superfamily enzyme YgiQ (UPF0313 family)